MPPKASAEKKRHAQRVQENNEIRKRAKKEKREALAAQETQSGSDKLEQSLDKARQAKKLLKAEDTEEIKRTSSEEITNNLRGTVCLEVPMVRNNILMAVVEKKRTWRDSGKKLQVFRLNNGFLTAEYAKHVKAHYQLTLRPSEATHPIRAPIKSFIGLKKITFGLLRSSVLALRDVNVQGPGSYNPTEMLLLTHRILIMARTERPAFIEEICKDKELGLRDASRRDDRIRNYFAAELSVFLSTRTRRMAIEKSFDIDAYLNANKDCIEFIDPSFISYHQYLKGCQDLVKPVPFVRLQQCCKHRFGQSVWGEVLACTKKELKPRLFADDCRLELANHPVSFQASSFASVKERLDVKIQVFHSDNSKDLHLGSRLAHRIQFFGVYVLVEAPLREVVEKHRITILQEVFYPMFPRHECVSILLFGKNPIVSTEHSYGVSFPLERFSESLNLTKKADHSIILEKAAEEMEGMMSNIDDPLLREMVTSRKEVVSKNKESNITELVEWFDTQQGTILRTSDTTLELDLLFYEHVKRERNFMVQVVVVETVRDTKHKNVDQMIRSLETLRLDKLIKFLEGHTLIKECSQFLSGLKMGITTTMPDCLVEEGVCERILSVFGYTKEDCYRWLAEIEEGETVAKGVQACIDGFKGVMVAHNQAQLTRQCVLWEQVVDEPSFSDRLQCFKIRHTCTPDIEWEGDENDLELTSYVEQATGLIPMEDNGSRESPESDERLLDELINGLKN